MNIFSVLGRITEKMSFFYQAQLFNSHIKFFFGLLCKLCCHGLSPMVLKQ
jgi:hypothetical protein